MSDPKQNAQELKQHVISEIQQELDQRGQALPSQIQPQWNAAKAKALEIVEKELDAFISAIRPLGKVKGGN
jgi:hypothetical protein